MDKNKRYRANDKVIPTNAVLLWIIWVLTMVFLFPGLWHSVDEYAPPDNILSVREESGASWESLEQLNVFTSESGNKHLAPDTKGYYSFIIANEANYPVSYVLNVSDENIHHVPILFRLKDGEGNYLVGSEEEWKDITFLEAINGHMEYQAEKKYTLDWHWAPYSDTIDTAIGIIAQNKLVYTLNFLVLSEQAGAVVSSGAFRFGFGWTDCWLAFLVTLLLLAVILTVTTLVVRYLNKKKYERKMQDTQETAKQM